MSCTGGTGVREGCCIATNIESYICRAWCTGNALYICASGSSCGDILPCARYWDKILIPHHTPGSADRSRQTHGNRMKSARSSAFGRKAVEHLRKVDPKLGDVITKIGAYKGWPASNGTHFDAVCRSIVFQQLSGKAAGTIHGRFQGLYGGRTPLPGELAVPSAEKLRAGGFSPPKTPLLQKPCARGAS